QPDQTPTPTPAPPPPQATTTTAPTTPPTPSPQPGPSPEPPPATDGHQVDCPNEGPLAELAAVLDELPLVDLSRWAVGGTHRRTWNPLPTCRTTSGSGSARRSSPTRSARSSTRRCCRAATGAPTT